jgi:alkylation response protein AidB-like acyl-CoA dehydrogenase
MNDTLELLARSVDDAAPPDALRARRVRDASAGFDADAWRRMAELGWLAVVAPESADGMGLGLDGAAVIAQRLGRAAHLEPFVAVAVSAVRCLAACVAGASAGAAAGVAAGPADAHPAEPAGQASMRLGALLDGSCIATLAWQPDDGAFDTDAVAVAAVPQGDAHVLAGACRFVVAPHADAFVVAAAMPTGERVLYWLPRGHAGLRIEEEPALDGTRLARLVLDAVRVSADQVLARGDAAARALDDAVEAGIVVTAAELTGVLERALELTLDYLKTRRQFGQPIGAFQSLQHRAVDMWMQVELARAALASALQVFSDPASDAPARRAAASSAKARAGLAAQQVAGQSVQLHGAIGFTDEYPLGLYVNRALVLAARCGTAAQHRARYAALAPVEGR